MWFLKAAARKPGDLDAQVAELIGKLTDDLDAWAAVARRFDLEVFCGWFMDETNEGVRISSTTLSALGARGIALELDIYDGSWLKRKSQRED